MAADHGAPCASDSSTEASGRICILQQRQRARNENNGGVSHIALSHDKRLDLRAGLETLHTPTPRNGVRTAALQPDTHTHTHTHTLLSCAHTLSVGDTSEHIMGN